MTVRDLMQATVARRDTEADQRTGDGLDGILIASPEVDLPPGVAALAAVVPDVAELLHLRERDRLYVAAYLGPGGRHAIIAGEAMQQVVWQTWKPVQGPAVRRVTNLWRTGSSSEIDVLGHLLAYGAANLLDPPEPVTRREYIREGAAASDAG